MSKNSVMNSVYKKYNPETEHRSPLGRLRERDGSIWERWYMFRNGDIWQYNPETKVWIMETKDELANRY